MNFNKILNHKKKTLFFIAVVAFYGSYKKGYLGKGL